MNDELIKALFTESIQTQISAVETLTDPMAETVELLVANLLNGQRIFCCGDNMTHIVATHFAQLMTTGMKLERPPFPVLALTANRQKQLAALGQSGDILFVIADNQDHDELAPVMESAISRDMLIIALTGEGSDSISGLLGANDIELRAPSMNPARVLETQLFIIHGLCEQIENTIFPQEH